MGTPQHTPPPPKAPRSPPWGGRQAGSSWAASAAPHPSPDTFEGLQAEEWAPAQHPILLHPIPSLGTGTPPASTFESSAPLLGCRAPPNPQRQATKGCPWHSPPPQGSGPVPNHPPAPQHPPQHHYVCNGGAPAMINSPRGALSRQICRCPRRKGGGRGGDGSSKQRGMDGRTGWMDVTPPRRRPHHGTSVPPSPAKEPQPHRTPAAFAGPQPRRGERSQASSGNRQKN